MSMSEICASVVELWLGWNAGYARDLRRLSAYQNLPTVGIVSECEHPPNASWSPVMIQSGIFTLPWIYALWNRMKIGFDASKPNPSRSDTSEAANLSSGHLR